MGGPFYIAKNYERMRTNETRRKVHTNESGGIKGIFRRPERLQKVY